MSLACIFLVLLLYLSLHLYMQRDHTPASSNIHLKEGETVYYVCTLVPRVESEWIKSSKSVNTSVEDCEKFYYSFPILIPLGRGGKHSFKNHINSPGNMQSLQAPNLGLAKCFSKTVEVCELCIHSLNGWMKKKIILVFILENEPLNGFCIVSGSWKSSLRLLRLNKCCRSPPEKLRSHKVKPSDLLAWAPHRPAVKEHLGMMLCCLGKPLFWNVKVAADFTC